MKKFPVALQLFSIQNDIATNIEAALKKVKEIGYDGVEICDLAGKSAEEIKKMCEEIGLVPVSAHKGFTDMMNNPNVMETFAKIGCKYIVVPFVPEVFQPGNERWPEVTEHLRNIGEKAKEYGLTLCYHNHVFEFTKINDEYALDIIYNEVPPELLQTELDVCWINIGGEDPIKYIHKYADRTSILHLKDFYGTKDENAFVLKGMSDEQKKEMVGNFDFRPLGMGLQDMPAILEAAEEAGVDWLIVEQDRPAIGLTPMESAKASVEYLKSIM